MKIEMWAVDRLVPYARNPRTHSEEQVAKIAASIEEFGFTNPILVDGAAGIIAGHGRLRAALALGLLEVPVIQLGHLSPAQKQAYIIADNKLALDAGWDLEVLEQELAELVAGGTPLEAAGFTEQELDELLGRPPSADPAAEERPTGSYQEQFGVVVICKDETDQARAYEALAEQGYQCRVVST